MFIPSACAIRLGFTQRENCCILHDILRNAFQKLSAVFQWHATPCGTQSWAVARAGWGSGPPWTHSRDCHLVDWQPVGSPVGPQLQQLLSAVGQLSCEPAGRSQPPGLQAAMLGCGARTVLITQGAWPARSLLFCGRLPTLICLPQPKSPLEVSRKKRIILAATAC